MPCFVSGEPLWHHSSFWCLTCSQQGIAQSGNFKTSVEDKQMATKKKVALKKGKKLAGAKTLGKFVTLGGRDSKA